MLRPLLSVALSFALIPTPGIAQNQTPAKITIEILEGEGAVNNIKQRTAREPIVQVTDENHKPVAGALVLFTAPSSGPSAVFNGANTLSITTDAQGRAVAQGIQNNGVKGRFEIKVHASANNTTADTVIQQINVRPFLAGGKALWIAVAVIIAGVTAGLIASNTGGSSRQPTVITPGPPSVGAQH